MKKDPRKRRRISGQGRRSAETEAPLPKTLPHDEPVRINKYIARAGVCSRRKADELVQAGQVKVNGEVVTQPGTQVMPGDAVVVNGRVISPRTYEYILLNKPGDTITTTDDERGRTTVLDLIDVPGKDDKGLFPVGRLDRHTTGVLLVTNDGELAHRLMHPRYEIQKLYKVRTSDSVKPHELQKLREGIDLEDGQAKADRVAYVNPPQHREVALQLHEGRNRQVRRMFEALGHTVDHLERVGYAGLTTDGLRPGRWRRLEPFEVRRLRHLVKLK